VVSTDALVLATIVVFINVVGLASAALPAALVRPS
jgi:hypothetical protein